ncbi:hypothetical protein FRC02_007162 [Tulasnella sp. 418]|nr:hypothetical protein FRC02_007162 [Tulasnella sp. 418]
MNHKTKTKDHKGKATKKSSLKAALAAHQARAAKSKRVAHAQKIDKQKEARSKKSKVSNTRDEEAPFAVSNTLEVKPKSTIPFEDDDHVLLVGEGNFTFTFSLVTSILPTSPRHQFTSTSYDSESECYRKYSSDTAKRVADLKAMGVKVIFGVDARNLESCKEIRTMRKHMGDRWNGWNKVIFNFPHVGAGITDQDRNILTNQRLLLGFLSSVAPFLSKGQPLKHRLSKEQIESSDDEDMELTLARSEHENQNNQTQVSELGRRAAPSREGSVLITLRDSIPYTLWDLPTLAKRPPQQVHGMTSRPQPKYLQVRSFKFHPDAYPGYQHCRTIGLTNASNEDILRGPCRTWEFVLKPRDDIE